MLFVLFFWRKWYIMISSTRAYTVPSVMSPKNPKFDSFFQDFGFFLNNFRKKYHIFGQSRDMVVTKPKIIRLNTIWHRFKMIVVTGVTRNTQKSQNHPKMDFPSFCGRKWPHFGSPNKYFWVKTDRGTLKHCFPSIYHGYGPLSTKNHLKYTTLVKSWNETC